MTQLPLGNTLSFKGNWKTRNGTLVEIKGCVITDDLGDVYRWFGVVNKKIEIWRDNGDHKDDKALDLVERIMPKA